jgi:hypothetical protein
MENTTELLFGRIAVLWGFCSDDEVAVCVTEQQKLRSTGTDAILGEVMLRTGVLSFEQVNEVLRTQHFTEAQNLDRSFGKLAVKNGIIGEDDVRDCLARQDSLFQQNKPVPRLGEMLVQEGKMTVQEMEAILYAQERLGRGENNN